MRVVAEIGKPLEKALNGFAGVEPAETVGAEVSVDNAVGERALRNCQRPACASRSSRFW